MNTKNTFCQSLFLPLPAFATKMLTLSLCPFPFFFSPRLLFSTTTGPSIVEEHISMDGNFDDLIALMPENDCRYALYDFKFTTNDDRETTKLAMISWAPDTAKIKSKMVYAGSKDALSRVFVGVGTKITATDLSELTEEICLDACKKFA